MNDVTVQVPFGQYYAGNARYTLDGTLLGTTEFLRHSRSTTIDGLTVSTAVEP